MSIKKQKKIRGSGGGGGGGDSQRIPVEADDTLQSKSYAKLVDLICEGPIVGLVDGAKSIYLDETPAMASNGTSNFKGFQFQTRLGTQNQTYLPGYPSVESENIVGNTVPQATPVVRSITNADVNRVRVRISIPQLYSRNPNNGDVGENSVRFQIAYQPNGGGYTTVTSPTIQGKSTSKYEKTYEFNLSGSAPWNIKITKVNADAEDSNDVQSLYWESFTEIIDQKLAYPNSAIIGMRFDASQFRSVPTRAYDIKGLRIRIPSNASVRTDGSLTYSGVWDGTFQIQWTTNPAWIFYALLIESRWGLGEYITSDLVDKWALYEIGQYCDELVPTGLGSGTEPRFSCNLVLQSREEALKVMTDMASIFRAMIYWSSGSITAVQDSPRDPSFLFTPANVIDGLFKYQGASRKTIFTVAAVTWNDPSDFFRQKVEYVEDQDGITRYGYLQTDVVAFGCTSRGQAHRLGKWILYTNIYESETVEFKTGLDGALMRPGDIIKIADPSRAGTRLGGRIATATTTEIAVDSDITENIHNGTMYVMLEDGSIENRLVLTYNDRVVTLSNALTTAPAAGAMWLISIESIEAQTFRVLSVLENGDGTHEVSALKHDPDKYDAIELGLTLEERSYSNLTEAPSAPTGLVITESLYQSQAEVRVKLTFSWDRVSLATGYLVQYRRGDGNFIQLPETSSNDVDILDVQPGLYTCQVVALNALGKRSAVSEATKEVVGKIAPPTDVENFSLVPLAGRAELSWDKATDLDVLVGGSVRVRWTPLIADQEWKDAVDIIPALPGNATRVTSPLLYGTYMAKFVDSSGVSSETESLIVTTLPEALDLNIVETLTEDPDFPGVKVDCEVDPVDGLLTLSSAGLIDDVVEIDALTSWDQFGNVAETATYDFSETIDLEGVFTSRVTASIQLVCESITDYMDVRPGNIDDWLDIDGDRVDDVFAEIYMRTTEDDPGGSPVWTNWKPFFVSEYKARAFQFQLRFRTLDTTHTARVSALSVTVDMPDLVQSQRNLASGTAPYTVTFPNPFYNVPTVAITAHNLDTGDFFQISNQTEAGFDIVFFDSILAMKDRNFDYLAKGYGRQVS